MGNIKNMRDIINYAAKEYGDNIAFKYKISKNEIESKSYNDLKYDSEAVSNVLKNLKVLGKHVAIIGSTSYWWIVSYFGIVNSGGVTVPIDDKLPVNDICELMERADVEVLIYDNNRVDIAKAVKEKCSKVKHIISMTEKLNNEFSLSLNKLMENNKGNFFIELNNEKLCTILFTSGTTGKSKGVMLNHKNLADNATACDMGLKPGTVSMTVLPINHVFCFTMDILKGIYSGLCICINDSIIRVSKNLKLFKPEIMCLVPMVIEGLYNKLMDGSVMLPKKLIAKAALGGNLKTIYSGGAYLNPKYIDGFKEFGIEIIQGYGMTECSPVISTNLPGRIKKESVGQLLPNCEAKIVDEEIYVKGSSVMMGYYKMPKETEETLIDGYLKTGDLGYIDEDNYLYITGRRKNLIILSNGENVSPEELENELLINRMIKEIVVSEDKDVIKAEIFPDYDYLDRKKIKNIEEEIKSIVDRYNLDLPTYKRINKVKIRETEFDKTISKKIKRQYINK